MTECFKIIKTKYPELKIHNFKPGSKAGDWTVPKIGNLKDLFLKTIMAEQLQALKKVTFLYHLM